MLFKNRKKTPKRESTERPLEVIKEAIDSMNDSIVGKRQVVAACNKITKAINDTIPPVSKKPQTA